MRCSTSDKACWRGEKSGFLRREAENGQAQPQLFGTTSLFVRKTLTGQAGNTCTGGEHPAQEGLCLFGRQLLDTPFGLLQEFLSRLQLIGKHEQSCVVHTEEGACVHQCLGQNSQPPEHCVDLTLVGDGERNRFDQVSSTSEIGGGQRVLYRFERQIMPLVPEAGTLMQFGHQQGLCLLQAPTQHVGKQVVVAVPAPLVVEGDHKQVRVVERFQHGLATSLPVLLTHYVI